MDISTLISLLATALGTLAMFLLTNAQRDKTKLWEEFNTFRLHVAEHYVKTTRLEAMEKTITDTLRRIEDKVDKWRKHEGDD
jgi:hypothetical protein